MSVGFAATSGANRVSSSSGDLIPIPRGNAYMGYGGVIFAHGATSLASGAAFAQFDNPTKYPNLFAVTRAVALAGLACVATDLGGVNAWASDAISRPIADSRTASGQSWPQDR